jgi:hypothetical protein
MKSYLRRVLTELAGAPVLTHTLPFEARLAGQRSAHTR